MNSSTGVATQRRTTTKGLLWMWRGEQQHVKRKATSHEEEQWGRTLYLSVKRITTTCKNIRSNVQKGMQHHEWIGEQYRTKEAKRKGTTSAKRKKRKATWCEKELENVGPKLEFGLPFILVLGLRITTHNFFYPSNGLQKCPQLFFLF